jgi:UDP-glucose 4-epimerase
VQKPVHQFANRKILVTGASGFIGTPLCRRLCGEAAEVHAVARRPPTDEKTRLRWWQADLADIAVVQDLMTAIKPDVIFHLAGHALGGRELDLVLPTFHGNLTTTVNMLTVAAELGCRRFVLASSLEEPEPAVAEVVPSSPYAASKWASSAYARMFQELYQTPVVLARIFMTYGPGQDLRKLIPYVILSLLRGENPKLSSGQRQIDWVYIEDVVEGLLAAAQAPAIEGKTVDVGSGTLVSIRTLVEHLACLINPQIKPLFGALSDRPLEQVRVADTARSSAMIGWKPTIALEEGLRRTVSWYERQLREGAF